jgi:hypothetical protein
MYLNALVHRVVGPKVVFMGVFYTCIPRLERDDGSKRRDGFHHKVLSLMFL